MQEGVDGVRSASLKVENISDSGLHVQDWEFRVAGLDLDNGPEAIEPLSKLDGLPFEFALGSIGCLLLHGFGIRGQLRLASEIRDWGFG